MVQTSPVNIEQATRIRGAQQRNRAYVQSGTPSKDKVAEVLGIQETSEWHIVDARDGLVMVGITNEADTARWGKYNGAIIDIQHRLILEGEGGVKHQAVVYPGLGNVFRVSSDEIEATDKGIKFADDDGSVYDLSTSQAIRYLQGRDGQILRIFKHRGTVYLASLERISVWDQVFGDQVESEGMLPGRTMKEVWKDAGGPDPESYFAEDVDTSPMMYYVSVFSQGLQLVGKSTEADRVLFLGGVVAFAVDPGTEEGQILSDIELDVVPMSLASLQSLARRRAVIREEKLGAVENVASEEVLDRVGRTPDYPQGSLGEARKFLRYGFHGTPELYEQDPRLSLGEFVIALVVTGEGKGVMVQISSIARNWRMAIRGVDEDDGFQVRRARPVLEAFFHLTNATLFRRARSGESLNDEDAFRMKFPAFEPLTHDQRQNQLKVIQDGKNAVVSYPISDDPTHFGDPRVRLSVIAQSLLLACSPKDEAEAAKVLDRYFQLRDLVSRTLVRLSHSAWRTGPHYVDPRVSAILERAQIRVIRDLDAEAGFGGRERGGINAQAMLQRAIRRLVQTERGDVLYSLAILFLGLGERVREDGDRD